MRTESEQLEEEKLLEEPVCASLIRFKSCKYIGGSYPGLVVKGGVWIPRTGYWMDIFTWLLKIVLLDWKDRK